MDILPGISCLVKKNLEALRLRADQTEEEPARLSEIGGRTCYVQGTRSCASEN